LCNSLSFPFSSSLLFFSFVFMSLTCDFHVQLMTAHV
jgi:hypothetical protein